MKVLMRRVLSLVLLLTQAATTFATPAFSLCISPTGHVCIDTPWNECTCCQDEEDDEPVRSSTEVAPSRQVIDEEDSDCCRSSHCESKLPPGAGLPSGDPPTTWKGKPCRCTHIPLVVVQDADQVSTARAVAVDRSPLSDGIMPADCGPVFRIEATCVPFSRLPHPPPSHLQAVACTVLRC